MLRATSLAAVVHEAPAGEIVAANEAAVRLLADQPGDQLVGRGIAEYFLGRMSGGLSLVDEGAVSAYETQRRTRSTGRDVQIWVRRLSVASHHPMALTVVVPQVEQGPDPGNLPWGGVIAIGSVDHGLIIKHVTADIAGILGQDSEHLIGTSLLELVDPTEAGRLIELAARASGTDPREAPTIRAQMRGAWEAQCELLLLPHVPDGGYAFTIIRVDGHADETERSLRTSLERLPVQARAATVAERAARLSNRQLLAKLGSRELEIVNELIAGQRVPAISRKLFLSQGTVRNHLSAAYRKLGVSSQQQLIDLLG